MTVALIQKAIEEANITGQIEVKVQHKINSFSGSYTSYFLTYADSSETNTSTMKFDHIGKLLAYIRSLG